MFVLHFLIYDNCPSKNEKPAHDLFCAFYSHTHSKTSLLNCFCRFPRNSPIICLLRPFLSRMKRAIPTGVSDTKPLSIRYWIPFSGFL